MWDRKERPSHASLKIRPQVRKVPEGKGAPFQDPFHMGCGFVIQHITWEDRDLGPRI